jgi:threonylcarbamoyladenosine tRNA methylthiotransferase MtaB
LSFRVAFQTFGCKLNQLETESLADEFRRKGASIVALEDEAELYVLNTCTVTSKAEQKARRLIRSLLGEHPASFALVTGCYAQLESEALAALSEEGRLLVVKGEDKSSILGLADFLGEACGSPAEMPELIRRWRRDGYIAHDGYVARDGEFSVDARGAGGSSPAAPSSPFDFEPESFAFHSRPSLKIEDGCNNRCSYCRVCLARGKAVSLEAPEVLARLRRLEEAGAPEAVLAGVNLSHYESGGLNFSGLLRYLLDGTSRISLRLSSYEPDRVDAEFLEVFAEPRIRPHVHFAIQSGSDSVLARMGRAYRHDDVLASCEALRRARRDPFLACDLITGFPGETEAEFADTARLAEELGFAWIHAFPFSPRPGTKAFDMSPRVPERVSGERAAVLGELGRKGRAAYIERWLGAEVGAVLEKGPVGEDEEASSRPRPLSGALDRLPSSLSRAPSSLSRATSENYLKLLVALPEGDSAKFHPGNEVRCRIRPLPAHAGPRGIDAGAELLP